MTSVIIVIALVLALVNLLLTRFVLLSSWLESRQRWAHFFLVWLVPVIGAAISWHILKDAAHSRRADDDVRNEYLWWNYPD